MSTSAAAFSSWEEALAKYIAYGGSTGYAAGLPGMVTSPNSEAFRAYLRLTKSEPRAEALYPNPWVTDAYEATARAASEPTLAEWSTYAHGAFLKRFSGAAGELEAVDLGSGQWVVRTRAGVIVTFPAPDAADSGAVLTHAVLCLPRDPGTGIVELYGVLVAELDTWLDATPAGADLTIPAQGLVFEVR